MGKLITLAVLGGVIYFVYWHWIRVSPAFKTYERWRAATYVGECKALSELAEGSAKAWADDFCAEKSAGVLPGMGTTSGARVASDMNAGPGGAGNYVKRDLQSEETGDDGITVLKVKESYSHRSFGEIKQDGSRMYTFKLREDESGQWKVSEFSFEDEKTGN